MNLFIESKFSPLLAGFLKNRSTPNALLNMTENLKYALDKGNRVVTLFVDLSKVSDTLNHKLLLAKIDFLGM